MLEASRRVGEILRIVPLRAETRAIETVMAALQSTPASVAISPFSGGTLRFERDALVHFNDEPFVIVHAIDSDSVLLRHEKTGRFDKAPVALLLPPPAEDPGSTTAVDLATISEDDWLEANRRVEILRPLVERRSASLRAVTEVATRTGLSTQTLYRWVSLFRRAASVTALLPHHPSGGRGKRRIASSTDAVIADVASNFYLTKQRPSVAAVAKEVERRCREAGLPSPHSNTVRNRLNQIPERTAVRARHGKETADDKYLPTPGSFPHGEYPLAVVQIDHSPADVILVDDYYRLPIGRPLLTVAIDVFTRIVLGFFVSLEAPSSLSVGMCLVQAILPKEKWLMDRNLPFAWPCYGTPRIVHADNAREFRGMMLERAAAEHGFGIEWRPVLLPRFGGHIERLMGTVATEMRLLPGATYSDVLDRGTYDSRATSSMTLSEYEAWLTQWITQVYHLRTHSALGMSPLDKWREAIVGSATAPAVGLQQRVLDEPGFRLTFLPVVEKTVQKYGIQIDGLRYWDDVLRPFVRMSDPENPSHTRQFVVRRDPRNISQIFFYDPIRNTHWPIPWSDRTQTPVTLWEWRDARRVVRQRKQDPDDTATVFRALAELRDRQAVSIERTQGARRKTQRLREAAKESIPHAINPPAVSAEPSAVSADLTAPVQPFGGIDLLHS